MSYQTVWFFSGLPEDIIKTIEDDVANNFDSEMQESKLYNNVADTDIRNSKNSWIPSSHWVGGFLWHYIMKANRENFLYDISQYDNESLQYTRYGAGEYYTWHPDSGISELYKPSAVCNHEVEKKVNDYMNTNTQQIRKLTCVLQLSNPEDYEGGQFQLLDETGKTYFAPKQKGTIIVFDSRTQHRVLKVTNGVRKSIVGWVVGPRWR
jgi:predicted 2-oxoglutarate/Fe(II)-dependent dioxygenase YbiX